MGRQIVKQPNGLYAQWSSVVDNFVMIDATPEAIAADWIASESKRLTESCAEIVKSLNEGGKPYCQFTMSFDECVQRIKELHGPDAESLRMLADSA